MMGGETKTETSEKYIARTPWDIITNVIDKDIEDGNGQLIRGIDARVYGIRVLGYPIAFHKTSNSNFKEIDTGWLPPEVEVYKEGLLQQVRYEIADFIADNLGGLLKNYREGNK